MSNLNGIDMEQVTQAMMGATDFVDICVIFESIFGPDGDGNIAESLIFESAQVATPTSVSENIQRGKTAMKHVISSHKKEPRAMYRKDLGWIGFTWGRPGSAPPDFRTPEDRKAWWDRLSDKMGTPFRGGYGVSHIIAKRDWEGKWIKPLKGQKGADVAMALVEVIAKGKMARRGERVELTHDKTRCVLVLDKSFRSEPIPADKKREDQWLLTGMELVAGSDYNLDPHGA